ncbi:RNA polymerase sigma-70 factor [Desertivirga xinjiangensis]|uniref:RNA polymerase sigma-70 factor n=1 Tax=Desertivirga xinjiangensis TaxID=539206 RepID=UPI002108E3D0|nr:RNA polymerase sigma-70 factor [Pedobacter xinjiangensis]
MVKLKILVAEYRSYTDDVLLDRLIHEDKYAFEEIYRRYWGPMYQSAYNILREKEACMDIVQELFVWIWSHHSELKINSLKGYLLSAVKFKVANYIRDGKIHSSVFEEIRRIGEPLVLPDEKTELEELLTIISRFTNMLPVKCREVFILSREEHLTNREIADRLGVSVKTVENQMTIALRKLRSSLARFSSFLLLFF